MACWYTEGPGCIYIVCMCVYDLVEGSGCVYVCVCILPCRGSRLCCRAWLAGRSTCVCSPASCSAAVTCSRRTTPTHTHTIIPNPSPNASPSTSPNIRSSTSPNTSPASNYTKHTHTHNYSQPTHTIISNPSPSTSSNIRSSISPKISPASCSAAVARSHRTRHTDIH